MISRGPVWKPAEELQGGRTSTSGQGGWDRCGSSGVTHGDQALEAVTVKLTGFAVEVCKEWRV